MYFSKSGSINAFILKTMTNLIQMHEILQAFPFEANNGVIAVYFSAISSIFLQTNEKHRTYFSQSRFAR